MLAKAARAEPSRQMRDQNCTLLWQKQPNCKKVPFSDHFWKLGSFKSARSCCAKMHEARFQAKMVNVLSFGAFLGVELLKTVFLQLWREARLEVKVKSSSASEHFWKLRCSKSACYCGANHTFKSKS